MSQSATVMICGRCGAPFDQTITCPVCESPAIDDWPVDLTQWRQNVVEATAGLTATAVAVDAAPVLAASGFILFVGVHLDWALWALICLPLTTALLTGAIILRIAFRYGRALGGFLFKLRTIDMHTGLPPSSVNALVHHRLTAHLKFGADPLSQTILKRDDRSRANTASRWRSSTLTPYVGTCYVSIGGTFAPLVTKLLVGRYPIRQVTLEPLPTLEVSDLTRTMSRSHAIIEYDTSGQLWITDLGSANGTFIVIDDEPQQVPMNARVPIDMDTHIICGEQPLTLKTELIMEATHDRP